MYLRTYRILGAGCLALAVASCSKPVATEAPGPGPQPTQGAAPIDPHKPKVLSELILGKWQRTDSGNTSEVLVIDKTGKVSFGDPGFPFVAPKSKIDDIDETIEWEARQGNANRIQYVKWKVALTPDSLKLTGLEAKHREPDEDKFGPADEDDKAYKGKEENYKRAP